MQVRWYSTHGYQRDQPSLLLAPALPMAKGKKNADVKKWLPTLDIGSHINARIQSPLPDYLYEQEIKTLYHAASQDPRLYLLVLLFLEPIFPPNPKC
jgi:hypothetical protein